MATPMNLWPNNEKIAHCGLCGAYTYMKMRDPELGSICEECRTPVVAADNLLARTGGIRAPRQGDRMPESELL